MLILGIDTSCKLLTLALSEKEKLLGQLHLEVGRELSEKLIPILTDFLKKHNKEINDVKGFAVGIGPGSFTGLRIGLSTVKGFVLPLNSPIVGISSLDILAQGVLSDEFRLVNNKKDILNADTRISNTDSRRLTNTHLRESALKICPIIDAKRNLVYSCIYKKTEVSLPWPELQRAGQGRQRSACPGQNCNGQAREIRLNRISKYFLISIDGLLKKINSETIFVGDGIALYKQVIKKKLGKKAIFAQEEFWYPRASNLLTLSHERFKRHQTKNAHTILPLYLYPKECQVRHY